MISAYFIGQGSLVSSNCSWASRKKKLSNVHSVTKWLSVGASYLATSLVGSWSGSIRTHSCGSTICGHSSTTILPSVCRSRVGAYNPNCSRRHHMLLARLSSGVVNQYCQSTALTCFGGALGNGFPAKSSSTSGEPRSSACSVRGTIGSTRHVLSEANHKFQSNRG